MLVWPACAGFNGWRNKGQARGFGPWELGSLLLVTQPRLWRGAAATPCLLLQVREYVAGEIAQRLRPQFEAAVKASDVPAVSVGDDRHG